MPPAPNAARRILERTGEHPVLTVLYDLDPSEFATSPARATQLRSLVDEAHAAIEHPDAPYDHADKQALRADLERVEAYLGSDDAPVSGARALAVFASGQDDVFETVRLFEPTPSKVVIAPRPFLEPLVAAWDADGWCVCLVNRATARIFAGAPEHVTARGELDDDVRGRADQGGPSQANYERSVDEDADAHLRRVARELELRHEREPFSTLVLGGTDETVAHFRGFLHGDLTPLALDEHLRLDVQHATEGDVRDALVPLLEERRHADEERALEQLRAAQGGSDAVHAAVGIEDVQAALTERRVQTLLLAPDFGAPDEAGDDAARAELVEAAVLQDAGVLVFEERPPATHLPDGVGAILRY